MQLSDIGLIANNLWYQIPNYFSFVDLGVFVVMPNHIHGILILKKTVLNNSSVAKLNGSIWIPRS